MEKAVKLYFKKMYDFFIFLHEHTFFGWFPLKKLATWGKKVKIFEFSTIFFQKYTKNFKKRHTYGKKRRYNTKTKFTVSPLFPPLKNKNFQMLSLSLLLSTKSLICSSQHHTSLEIDFWVLIFTLDKFSKNQWATWKGKS